MSFLIERAGWPGGDRDGDRERGGRFGGRSGGGFGGSQDGSQDGFDPDAPARADVSDDWGKDRKFVSSGGGGDRGRSGAPGWGTPLGGLLARIVWLFLVAGARACLSGVSESVRQRAWVAAVLWL